MSPVLILGCHFQIAFTVMAFKNPANMPASLASLNLVQGAARNFALSVYNMVSRSQSIVGHFSAVRDLYEVRNIQNEVPDGDLPLVCNPETPGVALEFRYAPGPFELHRPLMAYYKECLVQVSKCYGLRAAKCVFQPAARSALRACSAAEIFVT